MVRAMPVRRPAKKKIMIERVGKRGQDCDSSGRAVVEGQAVFGSEVVCGAAFVGVDIIEVVELGSKLDVLEDCTGGMS